MFTLLIIIHVVVSIVLIISILLQSGQAGGLSGAFGGGGGNQTLFGGRGAATFLTKATTYLGAAFMAVSFLLAMVQAHRGQPASEGRNLIQDAMQPAASAPAEPGVGETPAGSQEIPVGTGSEAAPLLPAEGVEAPAAETPAEVPAGTPPGEPAGSSGP
jgi:preprotein translocase subunit SecG